MNWMELSIEVNHEVEYDVTEILKVMALMEL